VGGFSVSHGTANGDFVGNFGGVLEILAEMNAWYLGLDALEGPAVLEGGVGFGVPGFLMSHSTGKINVNHAFGRALLGLVKLLGTMRFYLQEIGKGKT
jgi:hypothetical protein